MNRLIVLRGRDAPGPLPDDAEVLDAPEGVIARLGDGASRTRWVALAPDVEDPGDVARRIRAADPDVAIVWLGRDPAAWAELPGWRPTPPPGGDASLEALTADIAHRVGTPMTAILGYAELLQKSARDEKNRGRAARIVEQVHRVSDLIGELLEASRGPRGPN